MCVCVCVQCVCCVCVCVCVCCVCVCVPTPELLTHDLGVLYILIIGIELFNSTLHFVCNVCVCVNGSLQPPADCCGYYLDLAQKIPMQ